MSKSCNPKYLSNTTFFSDNLGTYISNGEITTNQITTNGDVILTGAIVNGSNSITFNEQYLFTDIPNNFHIYGTGLINFQGVTYNIGQILSAFVGGGAISPYPSITYDNSTNITTFTGGMSFPTSSIDSTSINNSTFVTKTTSQSLSGIKNWSGTQQFSSIQLNADLIVNNGGTTLTNATLQKINYLSGITSDLNTRLNTDETNITTLQTKTTGLSYNIISQTSTISNTLASSIFTFGISINGASKLVFDNTMLYCNSLSANVQTAIDALNLNVNGLKQKTTNITYSSPTTSISNTLNTTDLVFSSTLNTIPASYFTGINANIQTSINTANSNISILQTKTQYISSISLNTTISNTLNTTDLVFSSTLNTIPASYFTGISANIQDSINDAINKANNAQNTGNTAKDNATNAQSTANSALALAATANGLAITANGLAGTALTSAATANSVNVTQQASIDQNITDITTLQAKTFSISRVAITNVTLIGGILSTPILRITSLDSGLNQTTTDAITFAGYTTINNTLYLGNYNSIIVDGIINQTSNNQGSNQLTANTSILGNLICSGAQTSINSTTTQIGTNAISTLNVNSTTSFGGDVTMLSSKNLRLKNIVPILLDDILFGDNAGTYATDDVIFNMKVTINQPLQINNTCQIGTSISRNTLNAYTTTALLDSNTGMTLTAPTILLTSPLVNIGQLGVTSITLNGSSVQIGQLLGTNYLYGTTYVQNLYSASGVLGMAGQVFQQF